MMNTEAYTKLLLWNNDDIIAIGSPEVCDAQTIIAFDLDHTLVVPIHGIFFKNADDWIWTKLRPSFENLLYNTPANQSVVVFTNQGGITNGKTKRDEFIARVMNIFGVYFGLSQNGKQCAVGKLYILAGISKGFCKPLPTLLEFFVENIAPGVVPGSINEPNNLFVGDAAGREDDFASSDRDFAANCSMNFYTPGEFLTKEDVKTPLMGKFQIKPGDITPQEDIVYPCDPCEIERKLAPIFSLMGDQRIVVIYVGSPASGKSTITQVFRKNGFEVVNQDTIAHDRNGNQKPGTKTQCKKRLVQLLSNKNCRVVIDATHPSIESRKEYLGIAKDYNCKSFCVLMNIKPETCHWLNLIRCYCGGKYIPTIAFAVYRKKFQPPTIEEGFENVVIIDKIYWDGSVNSAHMITWRL